MSLFTALATSASGMTAQRARAELLVENIANADTTRAAEGGPYRRRDAVFQTTQLSPPFSGFLFDDAGSASEGVEVGKVVVDAREPDRRYMPGHPDADKDGYVAYPRVNPAEDMVDLLGASRSYQANVSAIAATKDMIQRSIDLLKA